MLNIVGKRWILRSRCISPLATWYQSEGSTASRLFSSTCRKNGSGMFGGFARSNLGLEHGLVRPVLASIRQLPEVDAAVSDQSPSTLTIDGLKRASEVFASFDKGGREHLAVQALLAECQQRLGLYDDAIGSIEELQHSLHGSESETAHNFKEDTILALAKVYWMRGDFEKSQALCEAIISTYDDLTETFPSTKLHMASAMTGKALSQLAAMKTMDDAYSVRDFFGVAIKFLERHPPSENTLPQAVALSNAGVAEVIYNLYLQDTNDVSVPMTPALKYLFQGLQKTKVNQSTSSKKIVAASHALEASIQANLAWGVINYEEDRSDRVKKASEYAKKALAFYDAEGIVGKEGLSWILSVVASCYHQAGNAVTAEGLLQSAISKKDMPIDTLSRLQLRDAYREYSKLCMEWDKREKDAENHIKDADDVESSLPSNWQGKSSGIHGSLWFWTPGDFL
ncbi:unnamed protein product [Pseudo-nitzschia multistriata]|uniref:MalT-like TPR region domain-containing protein n=1 Tax=Pseudo-nitzschia multistriata TaxID=183589 RepID=A0A448ZKN1_9STRA|nr:unnamed protein product [Pseudo-nitzschia multistriata]